MACKPWTCIDPFDLICLDLDMPRLSGIEVTRSVRAHAPDGVPILMITASATSSDVHEAHAAGITALLTKPFQTSQLRGVIARLLALSR